MTNTIAKLRPDAVRDYARENPDARHDWIVIAAPEAYEHLAADIGTDGTSRRIGLIHGIVKHATCGEAMALAAREGIAAVWYLREAYAQAYANIILSIDYAVTHGAGVLNISAAPPARHAGASRNDPDEPMSLATRRAAQLGCFTVFAIGNYGPSPGILNPWVSDWTIGAGAASSDGTTLFEGSARGTPGTLHGPTVVAHGIDSIGPMSTRAAKTPEQLEHEAQSEVFLAAVPEPERHLWTIASGTSFAAPRVAAMIAQIAHHVRESIRAIKKSDAREGAASRFFALQYRHPRGNDALFPRLAGMVEEHGGGLRTALYPLQADWRVVKQILIDIALPMPRYGPHEVGAGFVCGELTDLYCTTFGKAEPRIMACRAFDA